MVLAWDGAKYYEAGKLAGLINAIEFVMPEPEPTPTPEVQVPPFAGRDLASGFIFGSVYWDVKAGLDACLPDSQDLSDRGELFMEASKRNDWSAALEAGIDF